MPDNNDDMMMKQLLVKAETSPRVSTQADEKILSLISGFSPEKAKRKNPITYLRYNPVYSLFIIIPLIIILALSGTFGLFVGSTRPLPQLVFVSGSGEKGGDTAGPLTTNTLLHENSIIGVPEHDVCDLAIKDRAAFRFFPLSGFTVARLNTSSQEVIAQLDNGSLYLDKKKELKYGREIQIKIKNYLFVPAGTRVFFSVNQKSIQVSCFDGIVKVILLSKGFNRELYSLYAGEKIEIYTDGETREYNIRDLATEEMLLDNELRKFLPYDKEYFTRFSLLTGSTREKETDEIMYEKSPVKTTPPAHTEQKAEPVKEKEKKPFTISEIGQINDPLLIDKGIHFISTLPDREQAFIITKKKLFHLRDGRIKEINPFHSTPSFTMKPVTSGEYIFFISARDIYIVNKDTLTLVNTISISNKEVLHYNYHPVYTDMKLYIPVINTGYYTAEFSKPAPIVKEFYTEKFPLSPIVADKGIYAGSYNDNYIALLDNNGEVEWKYTLQGESWTNMAVKDDFIYTFVAQDNSYFITRINTKGEKDKEWQVDNKCIADIFIYRNKIFGIYIDGDIFRLDTKTGALKIIGKIIERSITSETWRSICPYIDSTLFYIGTEWGELLCYNMEKDRQEYRITVHDGESFYAPPCGIGKSLYLVSNSGKVFCIIKNEN